MDKSKNASMYRAVKRFFDVILSISALVALSPLLLVTCIGIVVSDGFPICFNATRIAEGKREFKMYKFRSMRNGADQIHQKMKQEYGTEEVSFKLKDSEDPRIFKFGFYIRKFGIDELPQLINIIKGDMSIVGPRPLPDYEARETEEKYGSKYDLRYSVPQGLTCYWQAYERSECDYDRRMELDCQYADEASICVDIKLIWDTFRAVISGRSEF